MAALHERVAVKPLMETVNVGAEGTAALALTTNKSKEKKKNVATKYLMGVFIYASLLQVKFLGFFESKFYASYREMPITFF